MGRGVFDIVLKFIPQFIMARLRGSRSRIVEGSKDEASRHREAT